MPHVDALARGVQPPRALARAVMCVLVLAPETLHGALRSLGHETS